MSTLNDQTKGNELTAQFNSQKHSSDVLWSFSLDPHRFSIGFGQSEIKTDSTRRSGRRKNGLLTSNDGIEHPAVRSFHVPAFISEKERNRQF